eukprot:31254-Pelagococcus_subviridis.AAC.3
MPRGVRAGRARRRLRQRVQPRFHRLGGLPPVVRVEPSRQRGEVRGHARGRARGRDGRAVHVVHRVVLGGARPRARRARADVLRRRRAHRVHAQPAVQRVVRVLRPSRGVFLGLARGADASRSRGVVGVGVGSKPGGVERRQMELIGAEVCASGLNARDERRDAPPGRNVLKDRRSPRGRGRTGTSVR